jgi:hypothetical protein
VPHIIEGLCISYELRSSLAQLEQLVKYGNGQAGDRERIDHDRNMKIRAPRDNNIEDFRRREAR